MLIEMWQNLPLHIDPIILKLGFFSLRWYSIGYILAFITAFYLFRKKSLAQAQEFRKIFGDHSWIEVIESLVPFFFVGMLIGAKIFYAFIYDQASIENNGLIATLSPFDKTGNFIGFYGLSFHGAIIGILIATYLWCKKKNFDFRRAANFVISIIPLAYFWGRLGNFMNLELFGRTTKVFWGMHFDRLNPSVLYHPSQLYEAFGEGLFLFFILHLIQKTPWGKSFLIEIFFIAYSVIRFFIEFFRAPDPQLGLFFFGLTMGQILSLIMLAIASLSIIFQIKRRDHPRH